MNVNMAIIAGRIGAQPEVKYTPAGQAVCELRVATSETWLDKQGAKQERTEWHSCTLWGKAAKNAGKYLERGQLVHIIGRLTTRSWDMKETRSDGQPIKGYKTSITVDRCQWGAKARGTSQDEGEAVPHGAGGNGGPRARTAAPQQNTQPAPAQAYSAPAESGGGEIIAADDDIPF